MSKRIPAPAIYFVLGVFAFYTIFPVLWSVLSSFKPQSELFTIPLSLFPRKWTGENYLAAVRQGMFYAYFSNSVFVAMTSTALTITINIMSGYALAKYKFPGREIIFTLMIATLMIPLQVIMIPIFFQLKRMGMLNTLWGIIIPPAATPTGVFLARQYIQTIPDSLIEAARIDGGNEGFIFVRIILPLVKPVIATIGIFSFMWRWNDFLWPLIVISSENKKTMQQALANFVGHLQINWSNLLAMTTITIIPIIMVFLIFQKFFIQGITSGSVKG
jgi:alpha-1,4-digalacturonate transport system permease protein